MREVKRRRSDVDIATSAHTRQAGSSIAEASGMTRFNPISGAELANVHGAFVASRAVCLLDWRALHSGARLNSCGLPRGRLPAVGRHPSIVV